MEIEAGMGINKEECDVVVGKYLERHFDSRLLENIDRKFKIAKKAIEMIPEKGVVILDSGTTVLQIAKLLNFKKDLVIITNSLIAAEVLENRSYKELHTKRKIIENSKKVVLVTDSSKFNIDGLYRFATFDQITNVITDSTVKMNQLELIPKEIEVSIV